MNKTAGFPAVLFSLNRSKSDLMEKHGGKNPRLCQTQVVRSGRITSKSNRNVGRLTPHAPYWLRLAALCSPAGDAGR